VPEVTFKKLAIAAVGAVVALSACSSGGTKGAGSTGNNLTSNETPAQAVVTAISKVGSQSSVKITLSLPVTQAQAEQLKGSSGSSGPTPAEAKALSTGSIFFTEATGHGEAVDSTQAQSDAQNSLDFGLTIGSDTPAEIRYIDQNLYVRAQITQLYTDVGQDPAKASQLTNLLSQLNAQVPGIDALGQGNWVEVSHAGLDSLAPAVKQAAGSTGSNPSTVQADFTTLRTQVLAALQTNSTIASLGDSNGRSEYSATINVSNLLTTLIPDLQTALASIPGLGSKITSGLNSAHSGIPAGQTAVVDLYVADNQLSEADLDINQFKHTYSFAVPLRVALTSPGAPSAPSGATSLDVSKLPGLLSGLLNGSTLQG
jgi:hypothetical protein